MTIERALSVFVDRIDSKMTNQFALRMHWQNCSIDPKAIFFFLYRFITQRFVKSAILAFLIQSCVLARES
jgi:hypothetical protein